jgi:two-component system sensor histidine kinase DegS
MKSNSIDTKVSKKFTRLYIIALSTVALLSIGGQILIQITLSEQSSDSKVVNIAGRQRMLSQKICKNAILISNNIDTVNREIQKKELDESLVWWHLYHTGLQSGNLDTLENKVNNSDQILFLFKKIEPNFLAIYNNAHSLSNTLSISTPEFRTKAMQEILGNEKLFLKGMDTIVYTYAQEAKERVDALKKIEVLLLIITLIILFLEGIFIFRPAVAKLKKTLLQLMESEAKANDINKELTLVNASLKITEEELLNSTKEKYKRQMIEQKIRSTSLVKGQESERKRIARDIHDGVGQMLTALKLNIESIVPELLPEKEKGRLEEARKLISKTIVETRTITFNLMPNVLSDFGIVSALKQLAEQASKTSGANVVFICPNTFSRLDKNIEIGVYRIFQEAINNAVKYSQAKEISIELLLNDNYIYLNITDNGKGFNMKRPDLDSDHKKINNGIYNMQERTNLLDGEFKITSTLGKGTKIWAKIPVKYQ